MRWFFALNEASASFWDYANLVQVAVHSARQRTSLQPVCLYDGADNALTAWLESVDVPVIRRRTFLHKWVADLAPIPRGAYLRLEIPVVCRERGWDDAYALYTDCDVVFLRDPGAALAALQPAFFAAAPEHDRTDFTRFNSGVMWINLAGLAGEQAALESTLRAHLAEAIAPPYDQAALQRHFAGRVDPLPPTLNWKPYWGPSDNAFILHFHGPKPALRYHTLNGRVPDYIRPLATPDFYRACVAWDELLIDALAQHPWPDQPASGIRDGFDSIANATGLGDPEGPFPEHHLPVMRWGIAPQTTLTFDAQPDQSLRFEAVFESAHPGQAVSVCLDDRELAHVALTRLSDPHGLALDLPPLDGLHRIDLHYALALRPNRADPRELGVQFRALRVRPSR